MPDYSRKCGAFQPPKALSSHRNYNVIVCPVYTQPAFPHGTSILDHNFHGFSHTMAYDLTGWPAAVVRCGESSSGPPHRSADCRHALEGGRGVSARQGSQPFLAPGTIPALAWFVPNTRSA